MRGTRFTKSDSVTWRAFVTDPTHESAGRLHCAERAYASRFLRRTCLSKTFPWGKDENCVMRGRAQYRLTRRIDWAGEIRLLSQPFSNSQCSSYGGELDVWGLPDLPLGVGYNFTVSGKPAGLQTLATRRGFYFTISSKLSNLFDLFGRTATGWQRRACVKKYKKDKVQK